MGDCLVGKDLILCQSLIAVAFSKAIAKPANPIIMEKKDIGKFFNLSFIVLY
jgi:hypothetical protein